MSTKKKSKIQEKRKKNTLKPRKKENKIQTTLSTKKKSKCQDLTFFFFYRFPPQVLIILFPFYLQLFIDLTQVFVHNKQINQLRNSILTKDITESTSRQKKNTKKQNLLPIHPLHHFVIIRTFSGAKIELTRVMHRRRCCVGI